MTWSIDTSSLLVPCEMVRLRSPRVVWFNRSYWLGEGWDLTDSNGRASLSAWLLDRFGSITKESAVQLGLPYADPAPTLWADRYGGTGGTQAGGSGRAAQADDYNAKGIGRTPLVNQTADWHHGSGLLWLGQAVREAAASLIAEAELPHGSVPIVAIIDAGHSVPRTLDGDPEPCAIVVRPQFLRPAHMERSALFGTSGFAGSDQQLDAQRVKELVQAVSQPIDGNREGGAIWSLDRFALRTAEQIGSARARRLWQGRFISGNVTVEGAWADLGSFCWLPDWKRRPGQNREYFGDDIREIGAAARSIAHGFRRYAPPGSDQPLAPDLLARVERRMVETAAIEFLEAAGLVEQPAGLIAALSRHLEILFKNQQRQQVRQSGAPADPNDWIEDERSFARSIAARVRASIEEFGTADWSASSLDRWLEARPALSLKHMRTIGSCANPAAALDLAKARTLVEHCIDRITASIRPKSQVLSTLRRSVESRRLAAEHDEASTPISVDAFTRHLLPGFSVSQ